MPLKVNKISLVQRSWKLLKFHFADFQHAFAGWVVNRYFCLLFGDVIDVIQLILYKIIFAVGRKPPTMISSKLFVHEQILIRSGIRNQGKTLREIEQLLEVLTNFFLGQIIPSFIALNQIFSRPFCTWPICFLFYHNYPAGKLLLKVWKIRLEQRPGTLL